MQESGEMYLETILVLSRQKPRVRAIDIAEYRHYSKPSISRALGILKNDGYINVDPDGHITFTEKGQTIAEKIYERHVVLSELLKAIGVSEETAVDDACRVEHDLSDETFDAIKACARKMGVIS
ncbi:MAG: metal-dependent transcriptional regulator [Lachnospiraceae bacterium]|nr:metal-dependent transcriptional regulator [Lachnospiraceae bacterium]MBR0086445.1 metal-dependent transcriptional regulator [Lachnospiraceae bacterium]